MARLGAAPSDLIGYGGEARVYALSGHKIARIMHPDASHIAAQQRAALAEEISAGAAKMGFQTPDIIDILDIEDRVITIERRCEGAPFTEVLKTATGKNRQRQLERFLDVSTRLRDIHISRPYFGELSGDHAVTGPDLRTYLQARAARSLAAFEGDFEHVEANVLANALPDCTQKSLVHLDLFSGNVLMSEGKVSAVIDFGLHSIVGDARLDQVAIVAYLDPQISPMATQADRTFAAHWLADQMLDYPLKAAKNWLAAYWTFAQDDPNVLAWCRRILGPSKSV